METLVFKTNMKCSGCIEKVTPALNDIAGKDHWNVDLNTMGKTLTVSGLGINEKDVQSAVQKAGFSIDKI